MIILFKYYADVVCFKKNDEFEFKLDLLER